MGAASLIGAPVARLCPAAQEVCSEETLEEIQRRYLAYNQHSGSYTWKRTDQNNVRFTPCV